MRVEGERVDVAEKEENRDGKMDASAVLFAGRLWEGTYLYPLRSEGEDVVASPCRPKLKSAIHPTWKPRDRAG